MYLLPIHLSQSALNDYMYSKVHKSFQLTMPFQIISARATGKFLFAFDVAYSLRS